MGDGALRELPLETIVKIEIDCPQCGYHQDVDSNTVPAGGATLTCKQGRYRRPYYKPQGMSARSGAALDAAARGARGRQMRAAGAPPNTGSEVACPGCGLRFAVAGENPPRPPARSQKRLGADDVLIKGMNMQENLIMKVSGLLGGK